MATAQPPLSSPIIRSAGTTTSSKNTSANSRSPLIISIGATRIPGASMSTKNAVMPRWRDFDRSRAREQHAAVGVLGQAGPDLLTVDDPGLVAVRASPSGTARQLKDARSLPVPGSENPWHHISAPESRRGIDLGGELGPREVDEGGREHLDEGVDPGIREVARRDRRAELRAQHRRAAQSADALRPAESHPARVEQDRLDALHLRDVFVERSGRRVAAARAPRGVHRATRGAGRGSRRSPAVPGENDPWGAVGILTSGR